MAGISTPTLEVASRHGQGLEAQVNARGRPEVATRLGERRPSLSRRLLRPRALLAAAAGLMLTYFVARHLLDINFAVTWSELRNARLGLVFLGLAVFYLVYVVRAARWRILLANANAAADDGGRLSSFPRLARLIVIAAFVNSVAVARLGDAFRAYLLRKESGVSFAVSLGTIVAERLLDFIVLVALLGLAASTALAGRLPDQTGDALALGSLLAVIGCALVASLRKLRPLVERLIPGRWHDAYRGFEIGTIDSLHRVPLLLLYTALAWLIEGATIYLLAMAVGAPLSVAGALVVGLIASLLSAEPFTPGGLGATETGIVLVLTGLGVPADTAAAIAVLNRVVNYLSLVVVGSILYVEPWYAWRRFASRGSET